MPTIPLPENASLEHLKSQAKLVRDLVRSGDAGALAMIEEFHPRLHAADLQDPATFKLADAQLIIARLYRCASWAKLREQLDIIDTHSFTPGAEPMSDGDGDEPFVALACLRYAGSGPDQADRIARAHEMLHADEGLAASSLEAACTVGDHQTVAKMVAANPAAVNEPCGPNSWPPLLYATYSRIETDRADWSTVETVKTLLAAGADPNAGFLWRGLVPPFTALTGAFGNGEGGQSRHPDRFAIARLLLEAGADPNDGQTLYNNGIGGSNHDDPTHLELLLDFGLGTQQNGPWYQLLDGRLDDPAEFMHHELEAAVVRDRPNHLRLLIDIGAPLDQPVGRSQKLPVRLAAENGNHAILAILAEAGIDATLTPDEQFLEAIRTSDSERLTQILADDAFASTVTAQHPGAIKAVTADGADVLKTLIALGIDINARTGGSGTTALHDAAQSNNVPLARLLIEHDADPNVRDRSNDATPWGWAKYAQRDEAADYLHPLTE